MVNLTGQQSLPAFIDQRATYANPPALHALGGAINAGGWATAAVVYAWTEPGRGGPRTDPKVGQLSLRQFAELGIRGLSKLDTVSQYRSAWERAVQRGWARPAARGEVAALPERDFGHIMVWPDRQRARTP
jgi:hypothetical protein